MLKKYKTGSFPIFSLFCYFPSLVLSVPPNGLTTNPNKEEIAFWFKESTGLYTIYFIENAYKWAIYYIIYQ